jgi:protein SCO1/2
VTLFGENNQAVSLFDPSDERVRVVYFGFTRCPDVCPTSLAMLAGALNQIDQPTKDQFRPIFISLDPERDAAADSYKYAQYFHPMIEGLSAPLDVTTPLAHKYGVIFRKTELENSELKYTLDHSSYFYFLKPDGTLITKVPHTLTPAPLVEAFKTITSKG